MSTGVLLSPTEVEPIVPLRGVVALGYKIRWDSRGCVISHPEVGRISCWLRNGCPVVRKQHALQLIKEIEDQERFKRLGPKLAAGQLSAEERQWWNQRYPDVPDSVLEFMVGQNAGMPKGETLPWNRRVRKRLRKAKGVIIHLFAGSRQSAREWQKGWPPGIEILTVDTADSDRQNLHRPEVWAFLAHVVRTHPVVAIKRPAMSDSEFGLPGLSDQEQHKVDGDSALLLKQIGLHRLAEESKTDDSPGVGFFLESPEDPAVWADEAESPTFWVWPEVTQLLERPDMRLISFDQGRYGHERVKPTSCLSNLPLLEDLDQARCDKPQGKVLHPEIQERVKQTAEWSAWAPGLIHALRVSLNLLIHQCGLADNQLKKALSREEWRTHILQGHRPYRRDCRACVLDMAAGPPHRWRMYPGTSAWSLGVDVVLFGKTKDSISGDQVKYAVVATALVPVFDEDHQPPLQEPPTEVVEAPDWGEGLEESEFSLEEEESGSPDHGDEVAKASPDPAHAPVADPENGGEASPEKSGDWVDEEISKCSQPLKLKHVTMVEPIQSRSTTVVLNALSRLVIRMKSYGINVNRLHSDRAKELIGKQTAVWCAKNGLRHTFGGGDDPANNGHVEAEINQLKRRTRLHLRNAGFTKAEWPTALRYSAEERMRLQLAALGVTMMPMLPYGASVVVKRKRWHSPGVLAPPYVNATLLTASPNMSQGWVVRSEAEQVLHVREAILPASLGDQVAMELRDESVDVLQLEERDDNGADPPRRRLVGKQPLSGRSRIALPDREVYGPVQQFVVDPTVDRDELEQTGEAPAQLGFLPAELPADAPYSPSLGPEDTEDLELPEVASGGRVSTLDLPEVASGGSLFRP
eukprot:s148_g15.t1